MNPSSPAPEPLVLAGGHSIQPVEPGERFAREAESVDRLAADVELINLLMWAQYAGADWLKFREVLARYGVAVLHKWILSGQIFRECATKGFGAVRRRRRVDEDEALGIAGETVAHAIRFFRERVLIPGVWNPAKGASVRTYFVGACVLHFPNIYGRVRGGERLEPRLVPDSEEGVPVASLEDARPFSRPDHRAELLRHFDDLPDEETKIMVRGRVEGYSDEEIGRTLNTTRKGVETRFYRLHRRTAR